MIDETKALRVEVAGLTRERDQLREALAAANARIGKEHDALVAAEESLAAAQRECAKLRAEMEEMRQENQFERLRDVPTMPPDFEDQE